MAICYNQILGLDSRNDRRRNSRSRKMILCFFLDILKICNLNLKAKETFIFIKVVFLRRTYLAYSALETINYMERFIFSIVTTCDAFAIPMNRKLSSEESKFLNQFENIRRFAIREKSIVRLYILLITVADDYISHAYATCHKSDLFT